MITARGIIFLVILPIWAGIFAGWAIAGTPGTCIGIVAGGIASIVIQWKWYTR